MFVVIAMYKQMYYILFNAVTDSIKCVEQGDYTLAEVLLKNAQRHCEEIYISSEGAEDM